MLKINKKTIFNSVIKMISNGKKRYVLCWEESMLTLKIVQLIFGEIMIARKRKQIWSNYVHKLIVLKVEYIRN